jgi:MATE family multidrug resistance protein
MNLVRPVMFAVISANLVNVFGNWVLIYGHLGAPALRAEGSGWSTCVARIYMAAVLLGYIVHHDRRYGTGLWRSELAPDLARIRRLMGFGLPAALQFSLELGVFATATVLIGKLTPVALAGHQIAINTVSFTYMVPLGVSSAAAVRVGQALGRSDLEGAERSGWTALGLGAGFMGCAGIVLLLAPGRIVRLFTPDATVIAAGASLLQTVATGALRGAGDTHTPMLCHLLAYWLLGLPLGYFLCFKRGWGAPGLWAGLCLALIVIGSVLLGVWYRKVRSFARPPISLER